MQVLCKTPDFTLAILVSADCSAYTPSHLNPSQSAILARPLACRFVTAAISLFLEVRSFCPSNAGSSC